MTLRRFIESPWFMLAILIAGDLAMMGDLLPRSFAYVLALLATTFVILAPMRGVVLFIVASMPFTPALPLPGFDSFALWRLIIAALVLRVLWEERSNLKKRINIRALLNAPTLYEWAAIGLFVMSFLSLVSAFWIPDLDLVAGLRKILFLANAGALYVVLRWLMPRVPNIKRAALKGLAVALLGLLLVGIAQYIVIEWVSLYDFWQGWTFDVIPIFYGEALGQTLQISNTWFAYYPPPLPPTLRMFSLLPDSHSFGVTMLIGFVLSGAAIALVRSKKYRILSWLAVMSFGVAIFVNGSRGIWITAAPTALVAYMALWGGLRFNRQNLAKAGKIAFLAFMLLVILFPISSIISSKAHGAGIDKANTQLDVAFRRARSIFELNETSNRGRVGIWKTNAKSVLKNPLLGVGIGNAALALNEDVSAARRGASAHNLYLDFAVETGILGGLFVLGFFLAIFFSVMAWLIGRKYDARTTPIALALVLITAWLGLYNLVDIVFINDRALLTFLVLLAYVTASRNKQAAT